MVPHLDLVARPARVHARDADLVGLAAALDHFPGCIAAEHAHGAVVAQQPGQGRDRLGEDPLASLALNLALLDAVERLLAHDGDVGAAHKLDVRGMHRPPGLDHALSRFQHHVLHLHGRHHPVETQAAQRHASLAAGRAGERRKAVLPVLGPAFGGVDEFDEALLHWVFFSVQKRTGRTQNASNHDPRPAQRGACAAQGHGGGVQPHSLEESQGQGRPPVSGGRHRLGPRVCGFAVDAVSVSAMGEPPRPRRARQGCRGAPRKADPRRVPVQASHAHQRRAPH